MTKLLKGSDAASAIYESVAARIAVLFRRGITPCLAIVRVGAREDDIAYEKSARSRCEKLGIKLCSFVLDEDATQDELTDVIEKINTDDGINGCLIFRPLPARFDEKQICNLLVPEKDVDGITDASLAGVFTGKRHGYPPCTAQACVKILEHYGVALAGKRVVVLGRSLVVGKPAAMLLLEKNATVTVCHSKSQNLESVCREADVLIAAVGRARFVTEEYLGAQQTVVDVGIHMAPEGSLCGDVDMRCADGKVAAITPVPGGVGAVTTALLMEHVVSAAEQAQEKQ